MFEIGSSLRDARLRQGLDLADAERATKIRTRYLEALEHERFEILPAQTYVKRFLRSYAEFLGLDGQLYVDEYNSRYATVEEDNPTRTRRPSLAREHRRVESNVLVLALAGIAAVTALVFAAWKWGGSEPQEIPGVASETTRPRGNAPRRPTPAARPRWIAVELTARRGNSSVAAFRGRPGGRLLFEGTLEQGKTMRFVGRRVWLNLSEPENLIARLNGRRVRLPASRGAPAVVVATARGIAPARAA